MRLLVVPQCSYLNVQVHTNWQISKVRARHLSPRIAGAAIVDGGHRPPVLSRSIESSLFYKDCSHLQGTVSTLLLYHVAAIVTRPNLQGTVSTLLLYHVAATVELLQGNKTVMEVSTLP